MKKKQILSLIVSTVMTIGSMWGTPQTFESWFEIMSVSAEITSDTLTYELLSYVKVDEDEDGTDDYISISDCDATATEIEIPSEIDELPVTKIGGDAFRDCEKLISVVIPDSVTSIEYWAFYSCDALKDVDLGNSITNIGANAFYSCQNLTNITIPDSVVNIGESAFRYCKKLKNLHLPEGLTTIDNEAFSDCCDGLTDIIIPESVTRIGNYAFQNCYNLKNITIPSTVTEIGTDAFKGTMWFEQKLAENPLFIINNILIDGKRCTGDVVVPEGITVITENAFFQNDKLKSIQLPSGLKAIQKNAFRQCAALQEVSIPDSVTDCGEYCFNSCASLKKVKLSENMTRIDDNCFDGCINLEKINVPESVKYICNRAFYGCVSLKDISFPDSKIYVQQEAFFGCCNLLNENIPNSITPVSNDVFYNYTTQAKYTYEIYTLSEFSGVFYDSINGYRPLYIKTENPDPESISLVYSKSYENVYRHYDDIQKDSIDCNLVKVDGGYVFNYASTTAGEHKFAIFEKTSDENVLAVGGMYNFTVLDYDTVYTEWLDEIIALTTTEDMTSFEKMEAVEKYMKEEVEVKYPANIATETGTDVILLASIPTFPHFITNRWNSMTSPACLYDFATRIGGFDKVTDLYQKYGPYYGGHDKCECVIGDTTVDYSFCPMAKTGRLDEIPKIDFTDESQLFVPESVEKLPITIAENTTPVVTEPIVTTVSTSTTTVTTSHTSVETHEPLIYLSDISGAPGETVEMPVYLECDKNMDCVAANLKWDDTKLETMGVTSDKNSYFIMSYTGLGYCGFSAEYSGGTFIPNGEFAVVKFKIPENAEVGTVYDIKLSEVGRFISSDGVDNPSVVKIIDGTITVTDASFVQTTPIETTITTTTTTTLAVSTLTSESTVSPTSPTIATSYSQSLATVTSITTTAPVVTTSGIETIITIVTLTEPPVTTTKVQTATSLSTQISAETNTPSLYLADVSGVPGETVKIPLNVKCNNNFESTEFILEWDDTQLKCKSIVIGELKNSLVWRADDGYCSITTYGSSPISDGTLATIEFTIPEGAEAGTVYNINFSSVDIFCVWQGENTPDAVEIVGGTITVVDGEPDITTILGSTVTTTTTTTEVSTNEVSSAETTDSKIISTTELTDNTVTTTSTTTEISTNEVSSVETTDSKITSTTELTDNTVTTTVQTELTEYLKGDANEDGSLNVRDAAYIASMLAKRKAKDLPISADYIEDKLINIRDAAGIARYCAERYSSSTSVTPGFVTKPAVTTATSKLTLAVSSTDTTTATEVISRTIDDFLCIL